MAVRRFAESEELFGIRTDRDDTDCSPGHREGYTEFLTKLAKASGIETPTREELAKLDRKRAKKGSNVTLQDEIGTTATGR